MKYKDLGDLYQIHKDQTIYLIGNGLGVLDISDSYLKKIRDGISIGVNSSHLWGPTTYQASSTWSCYLLSCHYGVAHGCRIYQGQGIGTDPSWPLGEATTISSSFFSDNNTINIYEHMQDPSTTEALFTKPSGGSPFFGRDNIMFTATNLATIMGANKIVYLGFDQRDDGHYYDVPELMDMYKKQTKEMKEIYSSDPHILRDLEDMEYKNINKEEKPQYLRSSWCKDKLSFLFSAMKEKNVIPVVHTNDSIVYDAGAVWKEL
jgi:hypothetical protein